jgi:hypothetical protein
MAGTLLLMCLDDHDCVWLAMIPTEIIVKDWLTWLVSKLESSITNASNKIAGVIGINKAEDLQ